MATTINPDISFFSASAANKNVNDVYKWMGPLYDHFNNVSTKFQIDYTGFDAGAGSGSGGFVISPTNPKYPWQISFQKKGVSSLWITSEPKGTYTSAPTSINFADRAMTGSNLESWASWFDDVALYNDHEITILEWDDAFLLWAKATGSAAGSWLIHVGEIYVPFFKNLNGINSQGLGICWHPSSIENLFNNVQSSAGLVFQINTIDSGSATAVNWTGNTVSVTIYGDMSTDDGSNFGQTYIPTPWIVGKRRESGRALGLMKYVYVFKDSGLGYESRLQDLDGNIRYIVIGPASDPDRITIPWDSSTTPLTK